MKLPLGLVRETPSEQTEIDVFRGQWSYELPLPGTRSGDAKGFITLKPFLYRCALWFGSFRGFDVLELGPLEGEITYHLHKMEPKSILAIEGRQASYLKCLIVKNVLGLHRARFMLGDFVRFLQESPRTFHFGCAQGVLYHMTDPVQVLKALSACCERLFVGSHYYDDQRLRGVSQKGTFISEIVNPRWNLPTEQNEREFAYERDSFSCTYYRHRYNVTPEEQADPDKHHHHGLEMYAVFMRKDDIVRCLEHFGMEVLEVTDSPDADRGPFVEIIAQRKTLGRPSHPRRADALAGGRTLCFGTRLIARVLRSLGLGR